MRYAQIVFHAAVRLSNCLINAYFRKETPSPAWISRRDAESVQLDTSRVGQREQGHPDLVRTGQGASGSTVSLAPPPYHIFLPYGPRHDTKIRLTPFLLCRASTRMRSELSNLFLKHFTLSAEETEVLNLKEVTINEKLFRAMDRVKKIREDCAGLFVVAGVGASREGVATNGELEGDQEGDGVEGRDPALAA
jgi:hypothetical protein